MKLKKDENAKGLFSTEETLTRWFAYIERFTPKTQIHYRMVLNLFAQYMPSDVHDVTLEHIEKYLIWLRSGGRCNRTLNSHLTAIKSFFHWLRDYHEIEIPTHRVKMFTEDPPKVRIITEDEYNRLLIAATPDQADVIRFLAHTGLRESEWRSLSPSNIFENFRMCRLVGKGRKQRVVPLSRTCEAILRKYLLSDDPKLRESFFRYKNRGNCRRMLCAVAKRAKIPRLGPHSLRHYFATCLYKKNVSVQLISKVLGHADVRTTEHIYVHIWPERDLFGLTDVLD